LKYHHITNWIFLCNLAFLNMHFWNDYFNYENTGGKVSINPLNDIKCHQQGIKNMFKFTKLYYSYGLRYATAWQMEVWLRP